MSEEKHTAENWRAVPGYEGSYEVSDLGRVRSLPRVVKSSDGRDLHYSGRILKCTPNEGYPSVALYQKGTRRRTVAVHRLVAAAFIGPRPEGMREIRHLNGMPTDNRVTNLKYGTHSENALDMLAHGTDPHRNITKCPQGHEYSGYNLSINPKTGWRRCKRCTREKMREYRKARRDRMKVAAACLCYLLLIPAGLWSAPESHADPVSSYTDANASRVCMILDRFPTFDGINGIADAIVQQTNLNYRDAGEVIATSVLELCPTHTGLIQDYIGVYAPEQPGAVGGKWKA